MRSKEQLEERISWYNRQIKEMQASDQLFPDDPVHTKDIATFEIAIKYLTDRINQYPD